MDKSQKSNCLPKIRKMVDKIMQKYHHDKYYKKIDLINKVITKCNLEPTNPEKMRVRQMITTWIQKHQDSKKTEQKPDVKKKNEHKTEQKSDVKKKNEQKTEQKPDVKQTIDKIPPLPKAIPVAELKPCPPLIDLTIETEVKKEEVIELEEEEEVEEQESEQINTPEELQTEKQTAEPQPVPEVNLQQPANPLNLFQHQIPNYPYFFQNHNPYFFNNMNPPLNSFYQAYNPLYMYPYNEYNYN